MIIVLTKDIIFLSPYKIATLEFVIMITVFTKISYIRVFMRTVKPNFEFFFEDCDFKTAVMITVLTKCPISESVLIEDSNHESQSSYQHRHHQQTPPTNMECSLMRSRSKHKQNSSQVRTNKICKRSIQKKFY